MGEEGAYFFKLKVDDSMAGNILGDPGAVSREAYSGT